MGGNITSGNEESKTITIESIKTAVLDGTTYYYIKADNEKYRASIKVNQEILPFLNTGDKIKVTYKESDVNEIISLEK